MRNFSILVGLAALTSVAATASASDLIDLKAATSAKAAIPATDYVRVNDIYKGVWLGTLSGSISSTNSTTSSSITIEPGLMLTDNIAVGLKFGYTSSGSFNSSTIFGSVRYYFDPSPSKQFVPFIGPFVGYAKANGGGNGATIVGGNAGFEYFLSPNVSFSPEINYFHTSASGFNTNTFSFAFGLTFWYPPK